jgi:hypothetical protein
MCRRATGHFFAATACAVSQLKLRDSQHLRWYRSSGEAQRGFCDVCGSNLFWRPDDGTRIAILAGTLDVPTGLQGAAHIFVGDKGDYYRLEDSLPQHLDGEHGIALP